MFLTPWGPRSAKRSDGSSLRTCSWAEPETQTPPGSARTLEARGDVHAITEQVAALDHHVADMHADAELEPPVGGQVPIGSGEPRLCLDGALDGFYGAGELGEDAIASGVGDPTAVLGNKTIHGLAAGGQKVQSPDLVRTHEPGIAGHVRREDGSELALDSPARRGHDSECLRPPQITLACVEVGRVRAT